MTWKVKMPSLSYTLSKLRVEKILVKAGDILKEDQVYMVVEVEKVSADLLSPFSCEVKSVLVNVGDIVLSDTPLLEVDINPNEDMGLMIKKENIANIKTGLEWITSKTRDQLGVETDQSIYSLEEFSSFVDDTIRIANCFKEFPIHVHKTGAYAIEHLRASLFEVTEIFSRLETFQKSIHEATRTNYLQTVLFIRRRRHLAIRYFFESLESAYKRLELQLPIKRQDLSELKGQVFVVYGQSGQMAQDIMNFLRALALQPVALSEEGRKIFEEIKRDNEMDFAVILLTLDDFESSVDGDEQQARIKQNVLLKLGFFVGRLGWSRVIVLCDKNIKLPSDYGWVDYTPTTYDGWKDKLVEGLQSAGFDINLSGLEELHSA